jgi:uncharacterized membrane protein
MISAQYDAAARKGRIVLRPNRSWSWRSNTFFVMTLLGVSITIAAAFALRGYWLVLPFSVLEMAALLGCLYFCVRRANRQEVLTFSDDDLLLERGHTHPEQVHRYPRFFTRIHVEPGHHAWYEPRIAIIARNERQEIGSFLCSDEKRTLINHLRDMIAELQHR